MNPITHALSGWCLAEMFPRMTHRERAMVTVGAIIPDIDGLGIVAELATKDSDHPLLWWTEYHHVLCHNLAFAMIAGIVSFVLARQRRALTSVLVFIAVHLHILGDLAGSRGPDGYQWPIHYLYPSTFELTWTGQWQLNAWPNIAITVVLLVISFRLAWARGYSVIGLLSARADRAFVGALRARFGTPHHS